MSLYAWKYAGDNTVVYTKSEEPSTGSIVCNSNGVEYGEFELHLLYNGEIDSALNPYINKISTDPETFLTRLRFYTKTVDTDISLLIFFDRYADGDIFPISKLKHNNITYEITDEQARNSVSNILPTQTGNDGKYLTTNGTTVSWATVQAGPKFLTFQNITASTWVSDNTYSEYSYKCILTCTGVTSSDYAQVIFNPAQSVSGNYANVCLTDTDTVTIYSKVNTAISIPTITVIGSN